MRVDGRPVTASIVDEPSTIPRKNGYANNYDHESTA